MGTRFISHRHIIPPKMASILTKAAFFAVICISFSKAGDITDLTEDCGSRGVISKVEMDNCDQDYDEECVVKYGETAIGKLYFTSSGAVDSSLDCKIYGNVGGIWLDFPGDCPLEAGEEIIYDIALDIASFFPPISVTGKWTL